MFKFRRLLLTIILCAAFAVVPTSAQANLTQILDSITNPDGTLFNGTLVITWTGSASSASGTVSPVSSSTPVYGGALSVLLVPTTTAPAGTYYVVVYSSSNGLVSWSEIWQVPPSATPLTLSQVRQSSTAGSGGGTPGPGKQYATLPIALDQVTGLTASLSALNSNLNSLSATVTTNGATLTAMGTTVGTLGTSLSNLTNTVNSLGSSGSSAVFVDSETPTGTMNGVNTAFSLTQTPLPAASLSLYRNGLLQMNGVNFTQAGSSLTFLAGNIPQGGDIVRAFYRVPGTSSAAASFADAEIPAGTITGTNATFTLATAPNPLTSLRLYKNGVLLTAGNDFTLSSNTITFVSAVVPQAGDALQASYRH